MSTKFKGIVLSSIGFEDNDKIVTVYSDKFGKISFIAKGVNKIESKNRYSIQTFSLSEFEIFKSRNVDSLSKLKTGNLITPHFEISKKIDNYTYLSLINILLLNSIPNHIKNFKLFENLSLYLEKLGFSNSGMSITISFLFDMLPILGFKWRTNSCGRCNKKSKKYSTFSFEDFSMICPICLNLSDLVFEEKFISYIKWLGENNFKTKADIEWNTVYVLIVSKYLFEGIKNNLGIENPIINSILSKDFMSWNMVKKYTYSVLTKI